MASLPGVGAWLSALGMDWVWRRRRVSADSRGPFVVEQARGGQCGCSDQPSSAAPELPRGDELACPALAFAPSTTRARSAASSSPQPGGVPPGCKAAAAGRTRDEASSTLRGWHRTGYASLGRCGARQRREALHPDRGLSACSLSSRSLLLVIAAALLAPPASGSHAESCERGSSGAECSAAPASLRMEGTPVGRALVLERHIGSLVTESQNGSQVRTLAASSPSASTLGTQSASTTAMCAPVSTFLRGFACRGRVSAPCKFGGQAASAPQRRKRNADGLFAAARGGRCWGTGRWRGCHSRSSR